jgi:hypothetical protein
MRAGDHLRMMYDNLSQDKNSLANLDQVAMARARTPQHSQRLQSTGDDKSNNTQQ